MTLTSQKLIGDTLAQMLNISAPNIMKTGLVPFEKSQRAPRTNEPTNQQTNKLGKTQIDPVSRTIKVRTAASHSVTQPTMTYVTVVVRLMYC